MSFISRSILSTCIDFYRVGEVGLGLAYVKDIRVALRDRWV